MEDDQPSGAALKPVTDFNAAADGTVRKEFILNRH